jgi:Bax protein
MLRIILISALFLSFSLSALDTFSAAYLKISPMKAKKKAFVEILLPRIQKANQDILDDRLFVETFFNRKIFTWNSFDRKSMARLRELSKKYKIKNLYHEAEYLQKIDIVPTSMALAQASVESAWGQSRFVGLANNIFGVWTYGKKGIIPENRPEGMTHKIKIYDTLDESIMAYMRNLNRNPAYKKFRKKRSKFRSMSKNYRGIDSADTMEVYSGIGKKYNELLKTMIKSNHFAKHDKLLFREKGVLVSTTKKPATLSETLKVLPIP